MRIGTRGSALALAQARLVAGWLGGGEIVVVRTSGDRHQHDRPNGANGAPSASGPGNDKSRWVAELEQALLAEQIDLAVHSAKDVPGQLADGLELLGAPARAAAEDVLIGAHSLDELPHGACVGTSSVRRAAQLRAVRADLEVVSLRGNVDTRLRKLAHQAGQDASDRAGRDGDDRAGREGDDRAGREGDDRAGREGGSRAGRDGGDELSKSRAPRARVGQSFGDTPQTGGIAGRRASQGSSDERGGRGSQIDAIVLASAGLWRLGRERDIGCTLDAARFVPAPGQGALALQARAGDTRVKEAVEAILDKDASACLAAERAVANALGASCNTPLGAHAVPAGCGCLELRAWVGLADGSEWVGDELLGGFYDPEQLGRRVAERMEAVGARDLLARAEEMAVERG